MDWWEREQQKQRWMMENNGEVSLPKLKGQPGPDWRNSDYYRGNSGEMADMVWHLKSRLTEVERENSMLKLKLNNIQSILNVD